MTAISIAQYGTEQPEPRAAGEQSEAASRASVRILEDAVAACGRFPLDEIALIRTVSSCLCRSTLLKLAGAQHAEYEDILVLSGMATAFAYHPQRHQPMQVAPDEPEVVERRIAGATGFAWEPLAHDAGGEHAWLAIRRSVDEGRAVHGAWIDDLIFCGYDDPAVSEPEAPSDGSRAERRRVLVGGGWDLPSWWGWDIFGKWAAEFGTIGRVGGAVPVRPRRDTIREVVAAMVRCAEDDPRSKVQYMRHAAYGLAGIAALAADLADMTRKPDHWSGCWLGGHCIYRQISGRAAAARFLRSASSEFRSGAAQAMERAARSFEDAAVAWAEWGARLGQEAGVTDAEEIRLLWLQAGPRSEGAAFVRQALIHETEAVRQLKQALRL